MESLLKPIEELTYDQLRKAYNLHRNQCILIAERLRSMTGEEEIISEFDSDLPKALECKHFINGKEVQPCERLEGCDHIFQKEKVFRKCIKCGIVRP